VSDSADYVRQVETYLCQKNRGHLVRVVGPAFEMVCAWLTNGVPLKVAFQGIDRACTRYDAKGPRRRPLRIEFCEADVLEAFDAWRRAVGVGGGAEAAENEPDASPRKPALASHVERAIAKLAHVRGTGAARSPFDAYLEGAIRRLEELASSALRARGDARAELVARLREVDEMLIAAAVAHLEPERARALQAEAAQEIAPFAARMPTANRERALALAFERQLRDALGLPIVAYD
jgi:hypothetical protein